MTLAELVRNKAQAATEANISVCRERGTGNYVVDFPANSWYVDESANDVYLQGEDAERLESSFHDLKDNIELEDIPTDDILLYCVVTQLDLI